MKLGVVSGFYPGRRFNSHVNHQAYCHTHGYYYIDASAPGVDRRRFFRKIEVVQQYLDLFDWLFWIDDDAYFTDFSKPLHSFLDLVNNEHMLICKSPSTKKIFTKFTSCAFFLKNSPEAHAFLKLSMQVDLHYLKTQFWTEQLGYFSNGDQDAFVYLTEVHPLFKDGFVKIVDHNQFNNRDFEFEKRLDEHFLVHFTSGTKIQAKHNFVARLGINKYIVPDQIAAQMFICEGGGGE